MIHDLICQKIYKTWPSDKVQYQGSPIGYREIVNFPVDAVYPPKDFINYVMHTNMTIINKMKDGELYFFTEAWWPGFDQLLYYRDIMKLDVRFAGLFHAGTEVEGDFSQHWDWARWSECAWLKGYDKVIVATKYMKEKLVSGWNGVDKVEVTGLPIPTEWYCPGIGIRTGVPLVPPGEKPIVIFNHRWAVDKGKDSFLELAERMGNKVRFRILTPRKIPEKDINNYPVEAMICPTKKAYFDELKKGHFVISFAILETFGYSVLEGLYHGLCPIVPARACYPEMYPKECLFGVKESVASLTDVVEAQLTLENLIHITKEESISFSQASKLSQNAANSIYQVLYEEVRK